MGRQAVSPGVGGACEIRLSWAGGREIRHRGEGLQVVGEKLGPWTGWRVGPGRTVDQVLWIGTG